MSRGAEKFGGIRPPTPLETVQPQAPLCGAFTTEGSQILVCWVCLLSRFTRVVMGVRFPCLPLPA